MVAETLISTDPLLDLIGYINCRLIALQCSSCIPTPPLLKNGTATILFKNL